MCAGSGSSAGHQRPELALQAPHPAAGAEGTPGRGAAGRGAHRARPELLPGVPASLHSNTPPPNPHSPAVTSGQGGAQASKSQQSRRLLPWASLLPGRRPGARPRPRAPAAGSRALTECGHGAGLEEQAVPAAARLQQDAAVPRGVQPPEQPQPFAQSHERGGRHRPEAAAATLPAPATSKSFTARGGPAPPAQAPPRRLCHLLLGSRSTAPGR